MNPTLVAAAAVGAYAIYKKKPQWLPAFLRPKTAAKIAALGKVTATSAPTPSALAGLDAGMASGDVASANGLLQNSADPSALYAMASDFSGRGYNNTAKALIAKADALTEAKKHGSSDDELFNQMMAASTSSNTAATSVPGVSAPGMDYGKLFK